MPAPSLQAAWASYNQPGIPVQLIPKVIPSVHVLQDPLTELSSAVLPLTG
jgi:hypothetical protein